MTLTETVVKGKRREGMENNRTERKDKVRMVLYSTYRQMDRQIDRWIDRLVDRQMDRYVDR